VSGIGQQKITEKLLCRPGTRGSPIILATQEAEIRRITVQSQLRQIVHKTISKIPNTKRDWQSGSSGKPHVAATLVEEIENKTHRE
jgi:hypothetical protein